MGELLFDKLIFEAKGGRSMRPSLILKHFLKIDAIVLYN